MSSTSSGEDLTPMTEAEREAALKDQSLKFMRQHRVVKRLVSKLNNLVTDFSIDAKALEATKNEYVAEFNDLSEMYDSLCEITNGAVPAAIKADFQKVESENSVLLHKVYVEKCKLVDSDSLSSRSDFDSVSSVAPAPVASNSHQQPVQDPSAAEPKVFSGDPLQYTKWRRSFNEFVASRSIRGSRGVYYLSKFLSGDAEECVDSILNQGEPNSFEKALKLLDRRFGSEYIVGEAFLKKLHNWPKIANNDNVGLRKFADYLSNVEVIKETNKTLAVLDFEHENRSIYLKTPDYCRHEWQMFVGRALKRGDPRPGFSDFCEMIRDFAEFKDIPSLVELDSNSRSRDHVASGSNRRSKFFQDSRSNRKFSHAAHAEGQGQNSCFYCSEAHFMTNCSGFLSLPPSARRDFCKSENLCFGCLRHGHSSKNCRRRLRCATCNRNHPTVLRDDSWQTRNFSQDSGSTNSNNRPPNSYYNHSQRNRPQQPSAPQPAVPSVTSLSTSLRGISANHSGHVVDGISQSHVILPQDAGSTKINNCHVTVSQHMSSMIVPVYLSHPEDPNKRKLIYAMLDSQSDASFITDRALSCFSVPATPQNIELCTMNSSMSVTCKRVTGFQVQGHGCEKSINLPALYSRPQFPSDRSHIPSAAICNKFPHLSRVANELMPLQNVEIGLLLGYDVSYVHQPQEIVASVNESDPYAVEYQ